MADPSNDHRIQLYSSAEDVDEVVSKAEVLLSQIEQYRKFLVQNRKYKAVDLSTFHNSVIKEHKLLQRVKSTLLSDVSFLGQCSPDFVVERVLHDEQEGHSRLTW